VCHTGNRSCFGDERAPAGTINRLEKIVLDRKEHPRENSYTTTMFEKGLSRIAQKVGEEAVETILAATGDGKERTVSEAADLMYHLTVLFAAKEMSWRDVEDELRKRMG
jgi:phosphoribosyl-ATP pyrophosphohydrolase/phosphoribosyl-AMP cyclohydrolase